ncbi:MAG: type II toxin-antitoxin system PemK/MazF family toxin [Candidatus Solibacter usitatus]|nr:type II toxin-antitoxin system PemK/MazF family toxin [Candidatus Solibacter usitatus]
MKIRPVLVAYISSVIPAHLLPSDVLLDPRKPAFSSTNLKTPSVLRLHKLATIHTSSLVRYLGVVSSRTQESVTDKLRTLLSR